jgi:hypothetical protein
MVYPAVDAGVHARTSPMLRVLDQLEVLLTFGHVDQLDPQLTGDLGRMAFSARIAIAEG